MLSIGIVGLPNVGKSTLFTLLTKKEVHIANYPFATIDPNVGVVAVPDERIEMLAQISKSAKKIPAIVQFIDIAGLVKEAYKGEGLGNQFLAHVREVNAIVQVVRCFGAADIIHVEKTLNPLRDIDTIHTELILKDLETVTKRLSSLQRESRGQDKKKVKDVEILKNVKKTLEANEMAKAVGEDTITQPVVKELQLLTAKPQIYLFNGKEEEEISQALKEKIHALEAGYLVISLNDNPDLSPLIQKAYETLGLISFLTTGTDETRAWTIKRGTKVREAAAAIHTDFEKKFIRAEVINWQKLLEAGSWQNARQKGWLGIEGKEYIVQDGDVIEFKI